MGRWEPDAGGRLRSAALELFAEHGYDRTTVADIAERAGVTPRTFFRYFADKREVLFDGGAALQDAMTAAARSTPPTAQPMAAISAALQAAAAMLGDRRAFATARHGVIAANAELRERELIKLATLSVALAEVLAARGVPAAEASLVAEAGVAVFRVGFDRWVTGDDPDLAAVLMATLSDLRSLAAPA